jgi:peptidyl-tRNA hydrolase
MSHVVQHLGPQVPRLRLGFRPPLAVDSAQWKAFVLSPIPQTARDEAERMLGEAEAGVRTFLASGIREAMNRWNRGGGRRGEGPESGAPVA